MWRIYVFEECINCVKYFICGKCWNKTTIYVCRQRWQPLRCCRQRSIVDWDGAALRQAPQTTRRGEIITKQHIKLNIYQLYTLNQAFCFACHFLEKSRWWCEPLCDSSSPWGGFKMGKWICSMGKEEDLNIHFSYSYGCWTDSTIPFPIYTINSCYTYIRKDKQTIFFPFRG